MDEGMNLGELLALFLIISGSDFVTTLAYTVALVKFRKDQKQK